MFIGQEPWPARARKHDLPDGRTASPPAIRCSAMAELVRERMP
jgi:hypothetical protein